MGKPVIQSVPGIANDVLGYPVTLPPLGVIFANCSAILGSSPTKAAVLQPRRQIFAFGANALTIAEVMSLAPSSRISGEESSPPTVKNEPSDSCMILEPPCPVMLMPVTLPGAALFNAFTNCVEFIYVFSDPALVMISTTVRVLLVALNINPIGSVPPIGEPPT